MRGSSLQTRWLLQAELAARADLFQPVEHRARQKVFERVFSDGRLGNFFCRLDATKTSTAKWPHGWIFLCRMAAKRPKSGA